MSDNNKKKEKVLVVDDDKVYTDGVKLILSKDFDIDVASNEREAIEKIKESGYDVVITDGNLIGGSHNNDSDYNSGLSVAKSSKESGAYVIGMSSESKRFGRIAGDYIDVNYKKPMDVLVLKELVRRRLTQEEFDDKYELDS